jgi:peptide/nickel transport system permease protein
MTSASVAARTRTRRSGVARLISANPLPSLALIALVLIAVGAAYPGLATSYDPTEIDPGSRLQPPSPAFLLGTDHLGRDIFTRILYGARVSIGLGLVVVALAAAIGTLIGAFSGYIGGMFDGFMMRIADVLLAFPLLLLAMSVVAALGPGLQNAMIALVAVWWAQYARVVRGQVLQVRSRDFVEAARAVGAPDAALLFKHILPNCMSPVIVKATLDVAVAILITAALSFVGLGARPPTPEWGAMITDGREFLLDAWWYPTFPGLAIFLTVMAFNLVGDGLRDLLDPRLRDEVA